MASEAEQVSTARRETRRFLEKLEVPEHLIDTAVLIISELVTNVVKHAVVRSPTASVELTADAEKLVLTVGDAHPYRPMPLLASHPRGGLGLVIVRNLAREAGGDLHVRRNHDTGGKEMVVELPLASVARELEAAAVPQPGLPGSSETG